MNTIIPIHCKTILQTSIISISSGDTVFFSKPCGQYIFKQTLFKQKYQVHFCHHFVLLQEKKRLTRMMQEKMQKKITSVVDDMSLHCENQKAEETCALKTSTETSDGKPFTSPDTHSAYKTNISPKKKPEDTSTNDPNTLTFSRQKLALIQCEYDPKSCGCCKKSGSLVQLKNCTGCKTAKYCSKDCQAKDWKRNHKSHCKEIQRLNSVIDGTKLTIQERHEKLPRKLMQAKRLDGEWSLETRLNIQI